MIQTCKQGIEHSLQRDNGHTCRRKGQVKHKNSGEEEDKKSKQNGSQEELVEVVVARINAVAEDVALLAAEEVEE